MYKLFTLIQTEGDTLTFEYPVYKTETIPIPKDASGNNLKGSALVTYLNNYVGAMDTKQYTDTSKVPQLNIDETFGILEEQLKTEYIPSEYSSGV